MIHHISTLELLTLFMHEFMTYGGVSMYEYVGNSSDKFKFLGENCVYSKCPALFPVSL